MSDGFFVHQFELGPWDNFIYFVGDKRTRTCAVVDPAWDAPSILKEAERLDVKITHILLTHSHFDHVNAVEGILKAVDAQVHMMAEEVDWSGYACENLIKGRPGNIIDLGAHLKIRLIHTPGHTPGSTSFGIPGALITGDTLFVDGCGRCDFVGGDAKVMYGTLKTLTSALPGETLVYPGHNYGPTFTARLDAQLVSNVYLQQKTLADFVNHRMKGKTANTVLPTPAPWSPSS